jgi:hypothetical protein
VTAELRLNLPVIAYGGAAVFRPPSDLPHDVAHLDPQLVLAIQEITAATLEVEPIFYNVVAGRDRIHWRVGHSTSHVDWYIATRAGDLRLLPVDDWEEIDPSTSFYCTMLGPEEALRAAQDRLSAHLDGSFVTLGPDHYGVDQHWLELTSANGTKARAVQRLKHAVGAKRVVVFGDNHNDVPMFEIADESYAVGHAVPELISVATGVLATNDEDGVAEWLAQL